MRPPFIYNPPTDPIPVLFETEELIFVNKPSGLLSVPGRLPEHQDNLLGRLQGINDEIRLIHRLDMDTSGVMVFAKTTQAQKEMNWQFERRSVKKIYLAEVSGQIAQSGTVNLPLMRDWPNRPLQKVDDNGKPSVTHWRVLERKGDSSIVELTPETGRSHQLRVHMAAVGHAILGDLFYADKDVANQSNRLLLHAYSLKMALPNQSEPVCIAANCEFFSTEQAG
ncbi:RluA family pseudouridine synthase [Amylibacter sp.]|nr:RluA family pseudouridine synthase [Amylibacter sp.]